MLRVCHSQVFTEVTRPSDSFWLYPLSPLAVGVAANRARLGRVGLHDGNHFLQAGNSYRAKVALIEIEQHIAGQLDLNLHIRRACAQVFEGSVQGVNLARPRTGSAP
jgi:hypothetical protein